MLSKPKYKFDVDNFKFNVDDFIIHKQWQIEKCFMEYHNMYATCKICNQC